MCYFFNKFTVLVFQTSYMLFCIITYLLHCVMLQNELAILEFIHLLVETMDRHFGNVVSLQIWKITKIRTPLSLSQSQFLECVNLQCELDIMFHLEKAHFMLEEMVMNGCIIETSKANILAPIQLMDKAS